MTVWLPMVPEVVDVCNILLTKHSMKNFEISFVTNILQKDGITPKQSTWLGGLSKFYIQKGVYMEHNWWPDKIVPG